MPKTVAFTIAFGKKTVASAKLLRATFKAVHPDIPFFLVDDPFVLAFARQEAIGHTGEITALRVMIGYFLSLHFERVIYFDADILILDELPELVSSTGPAVLTNDTPSFDYSIPAPKVNIGVLAAHEPEFWFKWMATLYSYLIPVVSIFFDQFSLRILCMGGNVSYRLLPELESRDFYNIGHYEYPGEWRAEGGSVFKGDARLRLWHWAGSPQKPSPHSLPEAIRPTALARIAQGRETANADRGTEEELFRLLLRENGPSFFAAIDELFRTIDTHLLDGLTFKNASPPEGLYAPEATAAWDSLRPPFPGLHRRLLPRATRYIYARDEARLLAPDVDALDVPRR